MKSSSCVKFNAASKKSITRSFFVINSEFAKIGKVFTRTNHVINLTITFCSPVYFHNMKKISIVFMLLLSLAIIVIAFTDKKISFQKTEKGFALVELFTSEGCSSCPPADEALSKIQNDFKDKNVLVLGFHVDYWDRLGWKDPFSSHDNTARQEYYSSLFNLSSIYTPEAVINGKYEFVGSDKNKIINSVEEQLKSGSSTTIDLSATTNNSAYIKVNFSVSGNHSNDDQLVLLLVQKWATTNVKRGENSGRILHHINIVRKTYILPISSEAGVENLDLPTDLKKENAFLAAFTQNKKTGFITGVTTTAIN